MIIIVERIEGEYAILEKENLETVSVPVSLLPNCREGAVYEITERKDVEEQRKKVINNLFESLKRNKRE